MDQSDRYAALDLDEATLMREGRHILAAYKMRPKPGPPITRPVEIM